MTRRYFYPRSPCGERLVIISFHPRADLFLSTLSLRRATSITITITCIVLFLSTLSLRRATQTRRQVRHSLDISIHALLAESDKRCQALDISAKRISIHALLAESDLRCFNVLQSLSAFLSTLSLRRATIVYALILANTMLFLSTLSLRRATAKVHKTVGHFCAYETNFMGIASSC